MRLRGEPMMHAALGETIAMRPAAATAVAPDSDGSNSIAAVIAAVAAAVALAVVALVAMAALAALAALPTHVAMAAQHLGEPIVVAVTAMTTAVAQCEQHAVLAILAALIACEDILGSRCFSIRPPSE